MQTFFFLVKNASPVKRGRGRPRKDSLGSNLSQVQAYFLDEGKTHGVTNLPTIYTITITMRISAIHTHTRTFKPWAHTLTPHTHTHTLSQWFIHKQ